MIFAWSVIWKDHFILCRKIASRPVSEKPRFTGCLKIWPCLFIQKLWYGLSLVWQDNLTIFFIKRPIFKKSKGCTFFSGYLDDQMVIRNLAQIRRPDNGLHKEVISPCFYYQVVYALLNSRKPLEGPLPPEAY